MCDACMQQFGRTVQLAVHRLTVSCDLTQLHAQVEMARLREEEKSRMATERQTKKEEAAAEKEKRASERKRAQEEKKKCALPLYFLIFARRALSAVL